MKGARPSFTSRFVAKTKRRKDRGFPSPFGLWLKPRGERTAALPSPLGLWLKPRREWTAAFLHSQFVAKTKGCKERGLPSRLDLWPNPRRGEKTVRPSLTSWLETNTRRSERSAPFLDLLDCGENKGVKGPRPSFTSRFVAKTQG